MKSKTIGIIGIMILLVSLFVITATALEVKQGTSEDLTIFLQNSSSGAPLTGITCVADVWNPSNTKIVDDGALTELDEGFYYYPTNAGWTDLGDYRVMVKCTISGENVFSAMMFEMVATTIEEYLVEINETTSQTYDYLQNTLYPAVDTLEASVADIDNNQTQIWNKLVTVESDIATNYNEIMDAQMMIGEINTSTMAELQDHRNRLVEINTTTWEMLDNITDTVNPKLDQLQTDIDLIKGYTDTIETELNCGAVSAGDVCSKLNDIISYTDTVESGITSIQSNIDDLNATVDTRFDAVDTSLSNIYADTQSILTSGVHLSSEDNATLYNILGLVTDSNTTIYDVKNYMEGTVTTYLAEINTTTQEINATVNDIYNYLQNTVYPAVDTLEASVADIDNNQTQIWNKLVTVESDIATNYNEIMDAQTLMTSVNDTVMTELIDHRNRLIEINTTTWASLINITLEVVPKIDAVQADTDDLQTELALVKNYVDSLEDGQSDLYNNLTVIQGYTDTLETGITGLENDISTLNNTVSGRLDTIDTSLSDIYTDTQSVINSGVKLDAITNVTLYDVLSKVTDTNATIAEVKTYLEGPVMTLLAEINTTTHGTYDYLVNTVYPAIDTLETSMAEVQNNNSQIWTKVVEIQNNVTNNFDEILAVQNTLQEVNTTVMVELVDHRQRLIELNTTTWDIYINITHEVVPKIDAVQADTDDLQTELALVKDYVDTLELGQQTIIGNISAVQVVVDAIDVNTTELEGLISGLDDMLDCDGSGDGTVCLYLEAINTTVGIIDDNTDSLEAGQTTITNYVDTLEGGQTTIQNYVDTLEDELNCVSPAASDVCSQLSTVQSYVDSLESGQQAIIGNITASETTITSQLTTIENYVDTVETQLVGLSSDISDWEANATSRFDAIDASLTNVYADTQQIVNSGVKLDAITNVTLYDVLSKVTDANATIADVKTYMEGSLTTLILDVNASITETIEFESNLTRNQIMDMIQSNVTSILSAISTNGADINSILTKWGTYNASGIVDEITVNRNEITTMQSWLDAFNTTEQARHNESMDLGQEILNWLGIYNGTEAQRHNITQSLLNELVANMTDSINLSNEIIAQLGINASATTVYDELVALSNQNNQIITLTNEINLTTHNIDTNLIELNTTISLIKTDTTDLLGKWGTYNSSSIMDQLTLMDGKLDIISTSSLNNTDVLNAVAQMESLLNETRAEIGFNGTGITAYEYLVNVDSFLTEMNTTIINKIEFEGNLTRNYIVDVINSNVSTLISEINSNEGKLDSLLAKWGSTNASYILENITENRDKLITIEGWLDAFNVTEQARHNESMDLGQDILNWLGIYNGTEAQRHNLTQGLLNDLLTEIDANENLSNIIISRIGYNGTVPTTLYEDIQTIITQNTDITILVEEINITSHTTLEIVNETMVPKLDAMHTTTQDILSRWDTYNASQLWEKTGVTETKVDTMQAWLDSFNTSEQTKYGSVIAELDAVDALIGDVRNDIGVNGSGLSVYDNLVTIDNKIVDMNTTLYIKMEVESNLTRQELKDMINANVTSLLTEINENEGKLDTLSTDLGNVSLVSLMANVTEARNQLTGLENWLDEFNATEQNRTNDVIDFLNNIILPEIDMTEELTNDLITQVGFNGSNETLLDKLLDIRLQQDYVANATQVLITVGNNLTTLLSENSQKMDLLKTSVDLSTVYISAVYTKWGAYNMQDIYNKLNLIELKVDILDFSNISTLMNRFDDIELAINQTRAELGFNGTSMSAFESLLNLQTQMNAVNSSLQVAIETQGNLTRTQIEDKITNATATIVNEVNVNENHLYDILDKWGNVTAEDIITNVTDVRNGITAIEAWLIAFNTTEQDRHDNETGLVQSVLDWLNVFGTTEAERHDAIMGNITETITLINTTQGIANEIIAQIGYNITNRTVYEDIQQLLANTVNITGGTGSITGINYVILENGTNMIALPMQPTNTSIESVMGVLADNYYRVDWYNDTSSSWQTYNPQDPFGNDLYTMETGKAYKIWVQEDDVLFIS